MMKVNGLQVEFGAGPPLRALDGIDMSIAEGEILGLVGESGSGKTVLSLAMLGLVGSTGRIVRGSISWLGRDLLSLPEPELRKVRGREISMIFQNPQGSLNPARTIGGQFRSLLHLHHGIPQSDAVALAQQLLRDVGIPDPPRIMDSYSFQLSPGLCQRVMIAMAISSRPKLLIADEPTASLDVTIQAQIMDLLLNLRERLGMAILLVSHDLGVVARLCDRVAVMYLGRLIEIADAKALYESPLHPYTQALMRAVPVPDPNRRERIPLLSGDPPDPRQLQANACRFRGRCPDALEECGSMDPALTFSVSGRHATACIRVDNSVH